MALNEGAEIVRLFSYGTLQLPGVQRATFGRLLAGTPDRLVGYKLSELTIGDPDVIATSGLEVHLIARRSGDPEDRVPGMVFELTLDELEAGDRYETDAYFRTEVALESGARAFVYVDLQAEREGSGGSGAR